MKKLFIIFTLVVLLSALKFDVAAQPADYTRYVNPFVGTGGHGHTFPGATVPFGAVQLSPDTRIDNWDGSSGYHYSDNEIYGFSHTHLSGTGIPDLCDILLMPTVGDIDFFNLRAAFSQAFKNRNPVNNSVSINTENIDFNNYRSTFSHANEKAEPGYYSVKIDNGVFAELTATKRVGLHRYTFPKTENANIVLDLKWRDKVLDSQIKIVSKNRIEGYRRSSSWAKDQIIYFVAEFSKPFRYYGVFDDISALRIDEGQTESGKELRAHFQFATKAGEQVLVKVAVSSVGIEGARKNLQGEIPDWNFEKVRADAKAAWNKELSQIEVSGGTDAQMTNFYTALYHTKIQPNIFQDVDGNYPGLDKKIHNAPKDTNFTIFSLWDTFRAAHPLYTIVDERRTADFINTFVRQYEQGGRLPVWELAGSETDTMIGYHAVSVIADAMAKNVKGFDYERAFEASKHSAELNHYGLEAYKKRGYISVEDENEAVSKTLEYAYDDFCIAQMAKILSESIGNKGRINKGGIAVYPESKLSALRNDYIKYLRRARYFENLYDAKTGFMRPKKNGGFVEPFAPQEVTFNFTEGNSWVYSFFVPQDVSRLIELQGGRANFVKKLDELFTTDVKLAGREQPDITGLIGQYAHGNEPSHHIAYLYDYAGEPWKTQKIVRRIMDEFYKPAPDGLIGNEDCGQMSAWYILSALGFYEVNPAQPIYAFGMPLFPEAKIRLENGKTFIIKAANGTPSSRRQSSRQDDGVPNYIKSAKLNGADYRKAFFTHADLMNGGVLEFEMTDQPAKNWFKEFPVSKIEGNFAPVPAIDAARVFNRETTVKISAPDSAAKIFYTTDGSEPTENSKLYAAPFALSDSATIKAVAINEAGEKSFTVESKLNKMPHDWTVKITSKYNRQYTGGGDFGLIDGIRGNLNFASGEWQGYQAQDFVAVVDLQKETEIRKLGGGFLQDARPWIWMPTRIEFETSMDGENFQKVADIKTDVAVEDMNPQIKNYFQLIAPTKARFVRVKASNLGKIPAWHPGAGSDAFIFVDEIIIE